MCAFLHPDHPHEIKQRMLVCAHIKEVGNRRVDATLDHLQEYCAWHSMETDVKNMARDCVVRIVW